MLFFGKVNDQEVYCTVTDLNEFIKSPDTTNIVVYLDEYDESGRLNTSIFFVAKKDVIWTKVGNY